MSNRVVPSQDKPSVPPITRDNFVIGEDIYGNGDTPFSNNVNIMQHVVDGMVTPRGPVTGRSDVENAAADTNSHQGHLSPRSNYSFKNSPEDVMLLKRHNSSTGSDSQISFRSENDGPLSQRSSKSFSSNGASTTMNQIMASNSIEIQSEKYIPLKFAQERIKKILADWTNMKLEYVKNLQRIELQYKTAEEEDREYMKNFVKAYAKKYKSVKAKLKSKINLKDTQIKTLVGQIEALQSGSDLPTINTEEILRQAKVEETLAMTEDQDDMFPTNLFDRRTFVSTEVQTAPVKLSDLKIVGSEVDTEVKEANEILNDEVSRLKTNLTEMADYYESQLKEKDMELEELSGQIADLESFKKKIMELDNHETENSAMLKKPLQKEKSIRDVRQPMETQMIEEIKAEANRKEQAHFQEVAELSNTIEALRAQIEKLTVSKDDEDDFLTPRVASPENTNQITIEVSGENQEEEKLLTPKNDLKSEPQIGSENDKSDNDLRPDSQNSSINTQNPEAQTPNSEIEQEASTIQDAGDKHEMISILELRLQQVKKKLKAVTNQKSVLLDSIENYKTELVAKEERLKEQKQELEKNQALILELRQKLVDAEEDIAIKEETIAELEQKLSSQPASETGTDAKRELLKVQTILLAKEQEAASALKKIASLQQKLEASQQEYEKLEQKHKKLAQESETSIQQLNTQQQQMADQMKVAMEKKIERALAKKTKELETVKQQNDTFKSKIAKIAKEIERIQKEKETLQEEVTRLETLSSTSTATIAELKEQVEQNAMYKEESEKAQKQLTTFTKKYDEMTGLLQQAEDRSRKLYNQIEDMKGKIRVYARVRPFSSVETDKQVHQNIIDFLDDCSLRVIPKDKTFRFNRVFSVDSTQDEVFSDTKDLIQSSLDGYNVCIFAYGQTGTGKTWTITGKPGKDEGILPKAIREVYKVAEKKSKLYDIALECQMVELYLDDLVDLLAGEKNKFTSRITASGKSNKLEVKKDANGNVVITNSVIISCSNPDQMLEVYRAGEKNRHQRATGMNPDSSRSHLVFTVHISAMNKKSGDVLQGKLSLVDLAGSESQKKTGLTDATALDEAKAINMSLLHLGEAINSLSTGKRPNYRNSVLTQLLSDSLGGTAKTLMFVCIGPSKYNMETSMKTLQYAERAKKIQNDVSKKVESSKLAGYKKAVLSLGEALRYAVENGGSLPQGVSLSTLLDEAQDMSHV